MVATFNTAAATNALYESDIAADMTLDGPMARPSLEIAPLTIHKSDRPSNGAQSSQGFKTHFYHAQSNMTPPATPDGSREQLVPPPPQPPPQAVFHNFLRAFYPFQPTYPLSDSTVTLPLNEGDVVLVHSIHTNGWADGTLLLSGARGWLPTNYCEAYEPEEMRNLLKALLNFWDLLRSASTNDKDIFGNQEFMKGIIAGVRYLLERTHCLTRESAAIQRNETLRRGRKSLLSELSSLVKTAKRLQETLLGSWTPAMGDVNEIVDEMILKAFKIILKGVRFVDLMEEDKRLRAPAVTVMATVMEESTVPPSPPAETTGFVDHAQDYADSRMDIDSAPASASFSSASDSAQESMGSTNQRFSTSSASNAAGRRTSQHQALHGHRVSGSISHRVSLAGPSPLSHAQKLVSEQLNSCHDVFLSYLGSFIGRLHLQSQSRPELALAIKQSATSGGELLAVVAAVYKQSGSGAVSLDQSRAAMSDRIRGLVFSAREVLSNSAADVEDVIMPQDNSRLLLGATGCVKAAGECVAKTKWAIERIGDFEFDPEHNEFDMDLGIFDTITYSRPRTPERCDVMEPAHETKTASVASGHSTQPSIDKPLPKIPQNADEMQDRISSDFSEDSSRPRSAAVHDNASMRTSVGSVRPQLPPLPKLTTSLLPEEEEYAPTADQTKDSDLQTSFGSEATTASSSGTNSTYLSRDSESSIVSQTSTRATTPDRDSAPGVPKNQPSFSDLSTAGSTSTGDEVDDVEAKLMEKTYAHELMFNKEGQVAGGSLPALVERLTTHESTPDAVFVSTFYLTFRLFCSPLKFAEALIERFDSVSDNPTLGNPVRLRVYNVMKGWLESHWREPTDQEALHLIQHFAEFKLSPQLPSAGKRLMELAARVGSTDGSLVPRLVSSMGKTSTSISQYVPADLPIPPAVLSKSQQGLLNNWKAGGTIPSVLDFEPLEMARQLTLRQMGVFCSILPEELLGSQWMKKGGVDSPNVKAMSAFSTDLSNLVADSILQYSEVKKRATMIKHWIKIAQQCLELNNYDGLMAIICSLNSSVISRLRKTWDFVSAKRRDTLKTLQEIVEPSQNNKVLRTRLQGHVPPCLPFLGMFLTDLTFVDIGNPATKQLPDSNGVSVVNFDKHTKTSKIIGDLQRFQIPYRLNEMPDMQDWIRALITKVKEADQGNVTASYYRKSLLLEPRETTLRTPVEGPPSITPNQKADLFGWISRDRHAHTNNSNNNTNQNGPITSS